MKVYRVSTDSDFSEHVIGDAYEIDEHDRLIIKSGGEDVAVFDRYYWKHISIQPTTEPTKA